MPNIEEIFKSIITVVIKDYAYLGAAVLLLILNVVIDTKYWPSSWRFYHPGWIEVNRGWLPFFLACALVSLYACRKASGFWIFAILCAGLALFFAHGYRNDQFSEGSWPFFVWVSYRIFLAFLVGIGATVVNYLAPKSSDS